MQHLNELLKKLNKLNKKIKNKKMHSKVIPVTFEWII